MSNADPRASAPSSIMSTIHATKLRTQEADFSGRSRHVHTTSAPAIYTSRASPDRTPCDRRYSTSHSRATRFTAKSSKTFEALYLLVRLHRAQLWHCSYRLLPIKSPTGMAFRDRHIHGTFSNLVHTYPTTSLGIAVPPSSPQPSPIELGMRLLRRAWFQRGLAA